MNMRDIIFPNVKKITISDLDRLNALFSYNSNISKMVPNLEQIEIQNSSARTQLLGADKTTGMPGLINNVSSIPTFKTIKISRSHPLYQEIFAALNDRNSWDKDSNRISIITT